MERAIANGGIGFTSPSPPSARLPTGRPTPTSRVIRWFDSGCRPAGGGKTVCGAAFKSEVHGE